MIDCSGLYEKASEKNYISEYEPFLNKSLGYRTVKDGFVVPPDSNIWTGGVYDANCEIVADTSLHSNLEVPRKFKAEEAEYRDETVVYFGLMYPLWGHCITDELSRAWFIKYSKDFSEKYKDCRIVCTAKGKAFGESFKTLLAILGIHSDNIEVIEKPVKFKEIIVPDRCFTCESGYYQFTEEYRKLIEEIRAYGRTLRNEQALKTPEKIYISYSRYKSGGVFGEDKLENFFRAMGFEVLYPEDHTFESQLCLMLGAKEIASTVGSCSHNSIFAEDDCKLTLIPRADYLGGYQPTLCALWNQETSFVDAHLSVLAPKERPWEGPFCFTVSDKLQELYNRPLQGDYDNKKDFENYLQEGFKTRDPRGASYPEECYKYKTQKEIESMYKKSIYRLTNSFKNFAKGLYHRIKK